MKLFRRTIPLGSAIKPRVHVPRKADLERCRKQGIKDRQSGEHCHARYRDPDKQSAYEAGYWSAKK